MKYPTIVMETDEGDYIGFYPYMPEVQVKGKTYDECEKNLIEVIELVAKRQAKVDRKIPGEISENKKPMRYSIVVMQTADGDFRGGCPFIPEAAAQGKTYNDCQERMLIEVDRCVGQREARGEILPDESKVRPVNVFYVPYVGEHELVGAL